MTDVDTTRHRGRYKPRGLPHIDRPRNIQAITYRLKDSLPRHVVERMERRLQGLEDDDRQERLRELTERFLDQGHGSCILRRPACAETIIRTWRQGDGSGFDLLVWTVMPNHVHVIVGQHEGHRLEGIVHAWRSVTSRRILASLPRREARTFGRGIWQRDYWDRYMRHDKHLVDSARYVLLNPVKAGLCRHPSDWPWSGYAPSMEEVLQDFLAAAPGTWDPR